MGFPQLDQDTHEHLHEQEEFELALERRRQYWVDNAVRDYEVLKEFFTDYVPNTTYRGAAASEYIADRLQDNDDIEVGECFMHLLSNFLYGQYDGNTFIQGKVDKLALRDVQDGER